MVRRERLANNATTTLLAAISSGDTTLTVTSATGFPTEGDFRIILGTEILIVTAVSGTTFTVTRGAETTGANSHASGAALAQIITKEGLERLIIESVDPYAFTSPPFRLMTSAEVTIDKSNFTNLTVTNATITDNADGSISIDFVAPSSTERFPRIVRTAPSAPYTITGCMNVTCASDTGGTGPAIGPLFRDSVNDEMLLGAWRPLQSITNRLGAEVYAAEVFSSTSTAIQAENSPSAHFWFQIEDNNTNLIFRYSSNGVDFVDWHTVARATPLTAVPDQIGFGVVNADVNVNTIHANLIAWLE
jgi:hypothetical protein